MIEKYIQVSNDEDASLNENFLSELINDELVNLLTELNEIEWKNNEIFFDDFKNNIINKLGKYYDLDEKYISYRMSTLYVAMNLLMLNNDLSEDKIITHKFQLILRGIISKLGLKPIPSEYISDNENLAIDFFELIAGEFDRNEYEFKADPVRYLNKFSYLPSIKGQSKRVYNYNEKDDFNTLMNYFVVLINNQNRSEDLVLYKKFLSNWTNKLNLQEITVQRDESLGINYFKVGNKSLTDVGFGITQLAAVLLKVAPLGEEEATSQVILMEEPESNLHPKFQSQLADLFLDAQKHFNRLVFLLPIK